MSESILKRFGTVGWSGTLTACILAWSFPAFAQQAIEANAAKLLSAMTDNLKAMSAFSVEYDADHEIIDLAGQKIQYSASGSLALDRARGFRMTRRGPFADADLIFDGKTISLYARALNIYAQLSSPGPRIEDATEEFRTTTGLDAPGADFLASDPYALLTEGVTEGVVVGSALVGGIECDHLAFGTDTVDWQIWISKGEKRLPIKYVITTKWVRGAPEYSLRLTNWSIGGVDAAQFAFAPPATATKVERVHADVTGELALEAAK